MLYNNYIDIDIFSTSCADRKENKMRHHKTIALLCSVSLLAGSALTYLAESTKATVYAADMLEFHIAANGEYTVTGCDKSAEIIEIPSSVNGVPVTAISMRAFEECTSLKSIAIPDSIKTIGERAFENCTSLASVILPSGLKRIEFSLFEDCTSLTSVSIPDTVTYIGECAFYNCTELSDVKVPETVVEIREMAFCNCKKMSQITIPKLVEEIGESAFTGCDGLSAVDIQSENQEFAELFNDNPNIEELTYVRPEVTYEIEKSLSPVNVPAVSSSVEIKSIDISSYTNNTSYNNGFGFGDGRDAIQEFRMQNGESCSVINLGRSAVAAFSDSHEIVSFDGKGWTFGGAGIDSDDCIYILWGRSFTDDDLEGITSISTLKLCKYSKNGTLLRSKEYPLSLTNAQFPFVSGNAAIGVRDGIVLAVFNSVWTKSENGLHHQGSEFIAANSDDLSVVSNNNWQGSHSFGISMIPVKDGFTLIQLGDAESARGINVGTYTISNGEVRDNLLNGKRLIYHASGQYGDNENFLDGNETFTHLGGIAYSSSTYAVAGKSEKLYTSEVHNISDVPDNIYNVFVRIIDGSLINSNFSEFAGTDRLDGNTGETADTNVIWLTECNSEIQAGAVKAVTLGDGSYCILWEQFVNGIFDSVHYVILDCFGNTIRPESIITNARLSDNSTQPIVNGYELRWAVTDAEDHSLTWYSVDLKSTEMLSFSHLGDVNLDNMIDSRDASAILHFYAEVSANQAATLTEEQLPAADINGDSFVDARDASLLLSYYAYSSAGNDISLAKFLSF